MVQSRHELYGGFGFSAEEKKAIEEARAKAAEKAQGLWSGLKSGVTSGVGKLQGTYEDVKFKRQLSKDKEAAEKAAKFEAWKAKKGYGGKRTSLKRKRSSSRSKRSKSKHRHSKKNKTKSKRSKSKHRRSKKSKKSKSRKH